MKVIICEPIRGPWSLAMMGIKRKSKIKLAIKICQASKADWRERVWQRICPKVMCERRPNRCRGHVGLGQARWGWEGGVWQVKVATCGSNEARIENAVLEAWHEASLTRLIDKRMPMKLKLKFTHTDTQTRTHVSVQLSEGVHKVHAKLFYAFRMWVSKLRGGRWVVKGFACGRGWTTQLCLCCYGRLRVGAGQFACEVSQLPHRTVHTAYCTRTWHFDTLRQLRLGATPPFCCRTVPHHTSCRPLPWTLFKWQHLRFIYLLLLHKNWFRLRPPKCLFAAYPVIPIGGSTS